MNGVIQMVRKELRQVFRDRNMIRIIFLMPLFQLFVLGYAITFDVKNLDLVVIDRDGTAASRALFDRFSHSEHFRARRIADPGGRIEDILRRGEAVIAMVVPEGFGRDLDAWKGPAVQVLLDGQNSNTAGIALGYCTRIVGRYAQDATAERQARLGTHAAALQRNIKIVTADTRIWYNPELRSVYFMIPGIVTILLLVITMLLTGLAIVKEREAGTLEQLLVTPLRPWQIIAGKTIPFALVGMAEMAIATTFGVLWFGIPVLGNVALLALFAFCFIITTLGLGVFISTVSGTQQQALFVTWFFMQIFILLSGIFYPIENMPVWIQHFTRINPVRYLVTVNRELLLKGAGLAELWPQLVWLLGLGLVVFAFATLRFHKRAS